jgi:hypothetical protein
LNAVELDWGLKAEKRMSAVTCDFYCVLQGQLILTQWQCLGLKNRLVISGLKAQFKLTYQGAINDSDYCPGRRPQIIGLCH